MDRKRKAAKGFRIRRFWKLSVTDWGMPDLPDFQIMALGLWLMLSFSWGSVVSGQGLTFGKAHIVYPLRDEALALQVAQWIHKVEPQLQRFFEIAPRQRYWIIILNQAQFEQALDSLRLPSWVQAVFLRDSRKILLRRPIAGATLQTLARDFVHELTHLYVQDRYAGQRVPRWYNEGLAEWMSKGRLSLQEAIMLANALWSRRLIPLAEVEEVFQFPEPQARLAYLESLTAVQFLNSKLQKGMGWSRFHKLVAEEGWPRALQAATGMDELDFQIHWFRHIRDRYRWMILLNFESLLWIGLLGIFVLIFVLIRRRNKKRLRAMEWEEQFEDVFMVRQEPEQGSHNAE